MLQRVNGAHSGGRTCSVGAHCTAVLNAARRIPTSTAAILSWLITCCVVLCVLLYTSTCVQVQEVSSGGQIAVAVKSSKDERYGCHWVITHDGRCMRCYTADSLQQFKQFMGPHYQKLQVRHSSVSSVVTTNWAVQSGDLLLISWF